MKSHPSPSIKMNAFWSLSTTTALTEINSTPDGLSEDAAQQRLNEYGVNRLKGGSRTSAAVLFLLLPDILTLRKAAYFDANMGSSVYE